MKRVTNNTLGLLCLFAFTIAASAAEHTVNIFASSFSPSSLTIGVGDVVTWVNQDDDQHSVSSNTGAWGTLFFFEEGESASLQFNSTGTFGYTDAFNGFGGSITVTAANTAPTVSITSPTNNTVLHAPATFTISATASDPGGSIANVQFLRDNTSISTDSSSPYSANVNNLAAGSYTLYAIATDNLGLKSTNSVSLRVNALPTVSFITPTNSSLVAAPYTTVLQVNAGDSDGTITNVLFSINGSMLGDDTNSPYSATVSNLFAGTYTFQATALDNNAGGTVASTTVTVINKPSLSGTAMTNGQLSFNVINVPASRTVVVEASTDFDQWSPISTNTVPASPGFHFFTFTTNTTGNPKRFYRLQLR